MPSVLRGFLSPGEIAALRARAETATWTAGRQGTGYDVFSLKGRLEGQLSAEPGSPIARALAELGTPFEDYWDVFLIRYLEGAHIPAHVDPAQHGKRHRRINAVLAQGAAGGELRIDGAAIDLAVGDAVVFYPDRERHEVSPVIGTRLLFSVGAWL